MKAHLTRPVPIVVAASVALAMLVMGFLAAMGALSLVVPTALANPAAPNPGHVWEEIETPPGTWPGLDADMVDGLHAADLGGPGYWTQAGSDLYANDTSWNVGVGTTSPDSKVHAWSATFNSVHGVTQASDKAGVWGYSEDGVGVSGQSNTNNGVQGGTSATDKAGVFGNGGASGVGVEGQSSGNHGVEGVTSSTNPMHAGVYGESSGAGPAIRSEGDLDITGGNDLNIRDGGDLYVTGAYYGNLPNGGAPFPRPAYDSGWIGIDPGTFIVHNHNIGEDPDKYVVDFQCRYPADPTWGINILNIGGNYYRGEVINREYGAFYRELKTNSITIERHEDDGNCPQHRVRIWVIK